VAVTRNMLRDQVKDALVERILDGVYGPGDRIVEMRVAEEFGVSQAPVREALRELELLRLVVSEPFRGARVREVTAEELREIYPVRAALEEVAARSATPSLAGNSKALRAQLKAMRRAAKQGDVHDFIAHDVAFHRVIVEASGNRTLQDLWNSLHVDLRTMITLIRHVDDLADVAESHVPVLEAIAAGDPEQAASVLRRHIEAFADWIPSEREP
jgi:DNA-binding GntR family transcriptional regulator